MSLREKRFIGGQLGVALLALAIGTLIGPLQAFEHADLNLYPFLVPFIRSYYQGLTLHGVLNALVFTTLFITGFQTFAVLKGLNRPLRWFNLGLAGFIAMLVGMVLAGYTMLTNKASVLYTFYTPMKASPWFYIGLTVLVVGSWMVGWSQFATLAAWRKENPGVRTPLIAFGAVVNALLWQLATLGIAAQMLVLVIPWALNLVPATDAMLSRTLFWFTGHPLVYFWLLPAYVSWYGMLPKQVGGKLFSDPLARLAFWSFLVLSTPVGFHHQFADPGVPVVWKYIHTLLTFLVVIPSMMTAFTVIASLERAGRKNGGTGLFGWIKYLNWRNPSVAAQLLAGVTFFTGGVTGVINASASLNLVIHNTVWIPAHFHSTVATASTLSFMGISFWLIPHLMKKDLSQPKVALASAWTWFVGMLVFMTGMYWLGLLGVPRRVPLATATYAQPSWDIPGMITAIGGAILLVAAVMYFVVILGTVFSKKAPVAVPEVPVAEPEVPATRTPAWLDNYKLWILISVVLVIIGYGPILINMFANINLTAPGFKVW
ncbi:MAG TPA: cbb3-type cytochrome c oxidase subunit I [Anaerolineaceae bacterium]